MWSLWSSRALDTESSVGNEGIHREVGQTVGNAA
jgi:hypothetical protein